MRALRPLTEYLRGTGAMPAEEPARPSSPADEVIAEYASYLCPDREAVRLAALADQIAKRTD
jgi:hypothetical protein